jgi:acyl carrier protein
LLDKHEQINFFDHSESRMIIEFDSIQLVELILRLEEFLGVSFNEEELVLDNFTTIANILKLVRKKRNSCLIINCYCSFNFTKNSHNVEP